MVHVAEACAECTQNCLLMHKKDKNPSPVATTFFKVMFGDDYSKVLYLPPRFARSVRNLVGKTTRLEDSSGEKWTVKFTKVDGLLAFKEGWNAFSTAHGLMEGDILVFHYIMESHFVVSMYGQSGCPEIRHFGFNQHQMKDTRKKQKLIPNSKPSNVNTNDHPLSSESSESERSDYEHPEIRRSVSTRHKDERIKKKGTVVQVPPSVNTKNTCKGLFASSSRPGPSVSGKELVRDENPDNMVSETPPTVKQICLVDDDDIENVEDEQRRDCLDDLLIPEINPGKSDNVRKNNVVVGGGGNGTRINESGKTLEIRSEESRENLKKSTIMPSSATCKNSVNKRLGSSNLPIARPKMAKKEPVGASEIHTPGSRLHDAGRPSPSTGIFPKSIVARPKMAKKEPVGASETHTPVSRLHDAGPSPSTGFFPKSIAKPMKVAKKELTSNNGSDECELKDTKRGLLHKTLVEEDNDCFVKPEPVDYDEEPSSGATNTLFSAVMSSYQYLELPEWVKLKNVVLLRNGGDLWPVLFQNKAGLKALTQSWEVFARERGIQPGDNCEFVLESEPNGDLPCSVFRVQVTAK